MTPRDRESLERLLVCVAAVDAYVARSGANWSRDEMAIDAIAKRIEEIGEVAKRISPATLASIASVDWRGVKGIRKVLVHDYDMVDIDLLVGVVRNNLPGLRKAAKDALAEL